MNLRIRLGSPALRFCVEQSFAFDRGRTADLGESACWLVIATILSAFDIVKSLDPITRHPIDPSTEFENFVYRCVRDTSRLSRSSATTDLNSFPGFRGSSQSISGRAWRPEFRRSSSQSGRTRCKLRRFMLLPVS